MFEFLRFVLRNKKFCALNVRNTKEYRKAMLNHRKNNPNCAYCGRSKKVDVHHLKPVSMSPELAADPENLITLCRSPSCHIIVGHLGNWSNYNPHTKEICKITSCKK